jgi:hypothetical protein
MTVLNALTEKVFAGPEFRSFGFDCTAQNLFFGDMNAAVNEAAANF